MMVKSLKPRLFRLFQAINRKTASLNFLKRWLGLQCLATRLLSVSEKEMGSVLKNLRTNYIESKVEALKKQGILDPDFYVLCAESMGDIVASEPIARCLKRLAPESRIHWIVRDLFKEVVESNPFIDETVVVATLAEGFEKARSICGRDGNILVNCHMDSTCCGKTRVIIRNPVNPQINVLTYLKTGSLLASFSLAAGLPRLDDSPVFYFARDYPLPANLKAKNYVAIHCRSSTVAKDWVQNKWEYLVRRLTARGIPVVEIGMPKCVSLQCDGYVDHTGKHNLQELAWIIKNALVFVGVDSGLAHIANAVRAPSLILLGAEGGQSRFEIYSGEFARSNLFRRIWAPDGKAAACIDCDNVEAEALELMSECKDIQEKSK